MLMSLFLFGAILFYYVQSWTREERLWLRLIAPFVMTAGLLLNSHLSTVIAEFGYREVAVWRKVVGSLFGSLSPLACLIILAFSWRELKPQLGQLSTLIYTLVTSLFLALTFWTFVGVWT